MITRRSRWRLRTWMAVSGLALVATCAYSLGACAHYVPRSWRPAAKTTPSPTPTGPAVSVAPLAHPRIRYIGVSPPGLPHSDAQLLAFTRASRVHPTLVSYYIGWGAPFNAPVVRRLHEAGALPLIALDSDSTRAASIAAGSDDTYLVTFARAVRALNLPVAISFDHEFNGPWFAWGYHHNTPAAFVAAWRRIVTVFRQQGATNVIWVWAPSVSGSETRTLRPYYPGNAYVTWVGVDGYFFSQDDTFTTVFGKTLKQIRAITRRPVVITETGVGPSRYRSAQIRNLFAGAARARITGVIWFDYNKYGTHNWRIDRDRAALAAFRKAARSYG